MTTPFTSSARFPRGRLGVAEQELAEKCSYAARKRITYADQADFQHGGCV
ncbi:hypothetical protein [Streptomyces sp. NBC_01707]